MTHYSSGQRPPAYELTLRFSEQARVELALESLFAHPALDGPYADVDQPQPMPVSGFFSPELDGGSAFASLGDGDRLRCSVRYELWPDAPAKVVRISFTPDDVAARLGQVDEWLAALGRWVFRSLHFELGVVGDSFLTEWTAETYVLPLRRGYGLLRPVLRGHELDVEWLPPPRSG